VELSHRLNLVEHKQVRQLDKLLNHTEFQVSHLKKKKKKHNTIYFSEDKAEQCFWQECLNPSPFHFSLSHFPDVLEYLHAKCDTRPSFCFSKGLKYLDVLSFGQEPLWL
jgi:hypothetical protein